MLRCADGSVYTGVTTDLPRRLAQHNAGKGAAYTRSRRPVALAWSAKAKDQSSALKRELKLKALSREEKLRLVASRPAGAGPSRRRGASARR